MSLISCFLAAPADQVDPRIIADAKTWGKQPTVIEVSRTLALSSKFPISRTARRVLLAIEHEAREAESISFDR